MVSPTVVATTIVQILDGVASLKLMVLWRGATGWFVQNGSRRGSGSGGSQGTTTVRTSFGSIDLHAELVDGPRAVRIQGKPVTLNPSDANVVLVDGIGGADLKVSTLKIDPAMTPDRQVELLLKKSPQIVAFLQCDQKLPGSVIAQVVERSCQIVMGK
jgi:hypothetical protein